MNIEHPKVQYAGETGDEGREPWIMVGDDEISQQSIPHHSFNLFPVFPAVHDVNLPSCPFHYREGERHPTKL